MIRIKVCGITNLEDAQAAIEYGADALGFIFAQSPRQVTPEQVSQIVAQLPPFVCKVGVFVDSEINVVRETMQTCGLDLAQVHGSENPAYCEALFPRVIKAFRVKDASVLTALPSYRVSAYLLDGVVSGQSFDWNIARQAARFGPVILAGGLTPANMRHAISVARPYAVDASSGIEAAPGKKDHEKLRAFVEAARQALEE